MKYLVITRRKDALLMLPQEQRIAIWEGMVACIEKYQKAGKCKEIYMYSDMARSVSIWESDSEEEVIKFTLDNPMAPFLDMDVQCVLGWDMTVKAQREAFQKQSK